VTPFRLVITAELVIFQPLEVSVAEVEPGDVHRAVEHDVDRAGGRGGEGGRRRAVPEAVNVPLTTRFLPAASLREPVLPSSSRPPLSTVMSPLTCRMLPELITRMLPPLLT